MARVAFGALTRFGQIISEVEQRAAPCALLRTPPRAMVAEEFAGFVYQGGGTAAASVRSVFGRLRDFFADRGLTAAYRG